MLENSGTLQEVFCREGILQYYYTAQTKKYTFTLSFCKFTDTDMALLVVKIFEMTVVYKNNIKKIRKIKFLDDICE